MLNICIRISTYGCTFLKYSRFYQYLSKILGAGLPKIAAFLVYSYLYALYLFPINMACSDNQPSASHIVILLLCKSPMRPVTADSPVNTSIILAIGHGPVVDPDMGCKGMGLRRIGDQSHVGPQRVPSSPCLPIRVTT